MKDNGTELESILKDKNLQDASKELVEVGLDAVLEDGLVKDIPIIGTLSSLIKVGRNISDRLFAKKILAFLVCIDGVSVLDRQSMIDKINDSKKYKVKVGEKLLFMLDKADDDEKASWIGQLFKAYLEKKLSYQDFLLGSKLLNAIDRESFLNFLDLNSEYMVTIDYELSDYSDFYWTLISSGFYSLNVESTNGEINTNGDLRVKQTMHLTSIGDKIYRNFKS